MPPREQARAQVYSGLLDTEFDDASAGKALILGVTATPGPFFRPVHPRYLLWQSLQAEPSVERSPVSFGERDTELHFLSPEDHAEFFGRSNPTGWDGFLAHYPQAKGLLTLSEVAFDPEGKKALVYAFYCCGGECGGGGLYELEQVNGQWAVSQILERVFS